MCKPNGAVCAKLAIFSAIALKKWRFLSPNRNLTIGVATYRKSGCSPWPVSRERKKEPRGLILSKACLLFCYLRSGWSAAFPRSTWSGWRGTRSRPWESRWRLRGGGEEKRHILHGGPKPFPGSSALAFALPKLTAGRTWIESPSGGYNEIEMKGLGDITLQWDRVKA